MEDSAFLEDLFDPKLMAILKLFFQNKNSSFYLREISKQAKVPEATTFRILKKLTTLEVVDLKLVNKFKFYQLAENDRVKLLGNLISKDPVAMYVESIKALEGIKAVMLYGAQKPHEANVIVIGDQVDKQELSHASERIQSQMQFKVNHLYFSSQQFEQMSSMGLYNRPKKILWKTI